MTHRNFLIAALMVAAAIAPLPSDAARLWQQPVKPPAAGTSPRQAAMDYVHIMDMRSLSDLVSVQWLPPLAMQVEPQDKAMFDAYVIIAVAHVSFTSGGTLDTHPDEMPALSDSNGTALVLIADSDQPAELAKFLDVKRALVRDATLPDATSLPAGPLREVLLGYVRNLKFYAYKAGAVHDCSSGRLTIRYAGEAYTFDTPLPGCVASH